MNVPVLRPEQTYIHLASDGAATPIDGGAAFWSLPPAQLERLGQGWLVSEFTCSTDWPTWEMHPEADELVYLLSGSACLLLELPGGVKEVPLAAPGLVVVPRGVWHTATVSAPTRLLHVTMGAGTQTRAA